MHGPKVHSKYSKVIIFRAGSDAPDTRASRVAGNFDSLSGGMMEKTLEADGVYSVKEIAHIWGVSAETARRRLMKEPGVMRFPNDGSTKRPYNLTTIPGAVAIRVTRRYTVGSPGND
jgi:hypothetical protein